VDNGKTQTFERMLQMLKFGVVVGN